MNIFLVVTIVVSSLALFIFLAVKNFRVSSCVNENNRTAPYLFLVSSLMFAADIAIDGDYLPRIASDMILAIFPLLVLNSSMWKPESSSRTIRVSVYVQLLSSLYYVLCGCGVFAVMEARLFMLKILLSVMAVMAVYLYALWRRVYEVKELMMAGTVWSYLNLAVDLVYMLSLIFTVVVYMLCGMYIGLSDEVCLYAVVSLLWLEMIALGLRVAFDSAFVIMQKHERIIVESMKISQVELSPSGSKEDNVYREIYERVLLHFEMKKPYLDNSLTINDVVRVVYSNKVYISRAISHYTGRNFRQFVNYYRVMHSMDMFRQKPLMKVAELASLSGFNSVVSFSTAFRLFMNETPSEWCRKERTKLIKTKK